MRTYPYTSSPTWSSGVSKPTRSTTPATSQPGTTGNATSMIWSRYPSRTFQSTGFTLAARTRTRTESGPTLGVGRSVVSRTSGPP
ncbi:Uncharacterised protein [Mycobacteroides abscessus]|nr:Uncharacterised protein [Mycobacteroides abscessus]